MFEVIWKLFCMTMLMDILNSHLLPTWSNLLGKSNNDFIYIALNNFIHRLFTVAFLLVKILWWCSNDDPTIFPVDKSAKDNDLATIKFGLRSIHTTLRMIWLFKNFTFGLHFPENDVLLGDWALYERLQLLIVTSDQILCLRKTCILSNLD